MHNKFTIHWFRYDLRLADNPSLAYACKNADIIPVYIFDDTNKADFPLGEASLTWLWKSLISLNNSLSDKLLIFKGNPMEILLTLAMENNVTGVFWNRCYTPWQVSRDTTIKQEIQSKKIECKTFNGSLLWEPWEVLKADGTPYKVFTPYYRRGCLEAKLPRAPLTTPKKISFAENIISKQSQLPKTFSQLKWQSKILRHASIGEKNTEKKLMTFLESSILSYKKGRDFPSSGHVSKLAPNLHFGEISPNQIWSKVKNMPTNENTDNFMSELTWREFSYYLLYHFPKMTHQNLQPKFDGFPWISNSKNLNDWKSGLTGIPMVDAGMRELWETGSMHNRLRMIVGSFLVKNLLIDWRLGARWFWECLFDADLASNTAGWQWIAGCGADAAPYYRIFNPVLQGKKFDPEGKYIKQYVPELRKLDLKYLFSPWEAPPSSLKKAGVIMGKSYPHPIVNLSISRKTALEAFKTLKNNASS